LLTITEKDMPMPSSTKSHSGILAANLETLAQGRLPRRKSRAHFRDRTLQQLVSSLIAARRDADIIPGEVAASVGA
jgi:hypothetical protein